LIRYKGMVTDIINSVLKQMPTEFDFNKFNSLVHDCLPNISDAAVRTHLSKLYYDGRVNREGPDKSPNKTYTKVPKEKIIQTRQKRQREKKNGTI